MICRYKAPRPYFHTFEGDDAQIGLNFADEGEAEIFQQTIEAKLTERRNRRERRQAHRRQQSGHSSSNGASKHGAINGVSDNGKGIVAPLQTVQINRRDQVGQPVKKGDKKKLKKEDIGMGLRGSPPKSVRIDFYYIVCVRYYIVTSIERLG